MNKKIKEYSSKLKEAASIAGEALENTNSKEIQQVVEFANTLERNELLKVPFVGDFSSGKSSLLNAIINRDLLPTNITPETAVSYELRYGQDERLEIYHDDKMISDANIDQIKNLATKPGDVVVVYLDNPTIKDLEGKGIILVDMPGIDSGLANHNAAINQYLGSGTYYMVFSDAEQGTFRNSSLSFINEILNYEGVDFSAFFSKADKKSAEEMSQMKEEADRLFKRRFGDSKTVGVTSATDRMFEDVMNVLNSIDLEEMTDKRYRGEVHSFIDGLILSVDRYIKLLSGDIVKSQDAIRKIQANKEKALSELKNKTIDAQPLESSAEDIVNDIRSAIVSNSALLASKMLNKPSKEELTNEFIQIIRPVFINSFKREISEYQDVISSVIVQLNEEVNSVLQNEGISSVLQTEISKALGKETIEGLVSKGIAKLTAKMVGKKGLQSLSKILGIAAGPVVNILIFIIPDLLSLIFGKSNSKKLQEIQTLITSTIADKIANGMRGEIVNTLKEQRSAMDQAAQEMIDEETQKIDSEIQESIRVHEQQKSQLDNKLQNLQIALSNLIKISETI